MLSGATLIHGAAFLSHLPAHNRYGRALCQLECCQRKKLSRYLKIFAETELGRYLKISPDWTYEDFQNRLPVVDYKDLESWIQKQRANPSAAVVALSSPRFEPTSGSTEKRKWIPYSPELMKEFEEAASTWIADLTWRHPGIMRGRHYWSLSWLPDDLRAEISTSNDLHIFPFWKQMAMKRIMAVPDEVSRLPSLEASMIMTLEQLAACEDLSLISVWSPTFAIELLRLFGEIKNDIIKRLRSNGVSQRRLKLIESWDGSLCGDFFKQLWPHLALVSTWDSHSSALWATELKALLPQAAVQGKGLWATEGVVTIPFRGVKPLAVTSHFYEFRDLNTQEILPSWELKHGQVVQPLLTTGSGFMRYALEDRLSVEGSLEGVPTFEFRGRLRGVDMVGEKMDPAGAQEILSRISREFRHHAIALLADGGDSSSRPGYTLLFESDLKISEAEEKDLCRRTEELCAAFHHYKLARQLGQLREAQCFAARSGIKVYTSLSRVEGLRGQIKFEPLLQVNRDVLLRLKTDSGFGNFSEGRSYAESARA